MYLGIILVSAYLHHFQIHQNPNLYCLLDFTTQNYFENFEFLESKKKLAPRVQSNLGFMAEFEYFKYLIDYFRIRYLNSTS